MFIPCKQKSKGIRNSGIPKWLEHLGQPGQEEASSECEVGILCCLKMLTTEDSHHQGA